MLKCLHVEVPAGLMRLHLGAQSLIYTGIQTGRVFLPISVQGSYLAMPHASGSRSASIQGLFACKKTMPGILITMHIGYRLAKKV